MARIVKTAMTAGMIAFVGVEAGWLADDAEALPEADGVVSVADEPIDDEEGCVLDVERPLVEDEKSGTTDVAESGVDPMFE